MGQPPLGGEELRLPKKLFNPYTDPTLLSNTNMDDT